MISVKTFKNIVNNYFSEKPIILASQSSAVYLGLTYLVTPEIYIYNPEHLMIQSNDFKIIELDDTKKNLKEFVLEENGILCTDVNLTIIDMIRYDDYSSVCLESLRTYYYKNNNSFSDLTIPDNLLNRFNRYVKSIQNEENLDY